MTHSAVRRKALSALSALLLFVGSCRAFAPSSLSSSSAGRRIGGQNAAPTVTARKLSPESYLDHHHALESASTNLALFWKKVNPEDARGQFYFFFGAGTGAGGIGLGQVPKILQELGELRALGGQGPTLGGPAYKPTNPLATTFFPADLCQADVERVIAQIPSPEAIVARGVSTSYFASKGYVAREDFMDALTEGQKCNPLASAAAFEALSRGSGSVVSPVDLEERVESYRGEEGLAAFGGDLAAAATTRLGAYAGLAFLLFIVFDLIIESGLNAFFPDL